MASGKPPLHSVLLTTSSNVAAGSALNLGVNRTEFGSMTTTGAVRMLNSGGNTWNGRIAIQGSATTTNALIRYTARTTNSATHCTLGNGNLASGGFTTNLPLWNPGYTGKTVYYHTSWTNAFILYRQGETDTFIDVPMTRIGNGRSAGEFLYQVTGISEAGRPIEFVLHGQNTSGVMQWDNPAVGGIGNPANYYTFIDTFFVQDGNIYNYFPPATVSAPQVISVASWPSSYTGNGIPTRGGRIYLPRGYTQNTSKRYPVLYMHDGQNVFDPGGSFGSWSADAAATREITQGRMRETIIIAVNNTGSRMQEYGTPQDGYTGNFYLLYLINNVMPAINGSYRTLTNMMDTGNMGSSLGGLISAYIGLSTNKFGLIGAVSPSYWYGPNFRNWINTQPTKGKRIWQCAGTAEGASMWDHFWPVYNYYMQDDYIVNDDIMVAIGCGQGHNEAAWAARIHGAFRYLYNTWDEINLLVTNAPPSPGSLQFTASTTNVQEMAGNVRVYVSRNDGSDDAASVQYFTSNGTAMAGADYTHVSGSLNWTNNDAATKFIDVPILDDEIFEGNQTFTVRLTGATGASLGSPAIITVTIIDNEAPPPQLVITNPSTDIVVDESIDTYDVQGTAILASWQGLFWSNSLTGNSGNFPITTSWSANGIPLAPGDNVIKVMATNGTPVVITNAADSASDPAYTSSWSTNNGGFGFGNWIIYTSSPHPNSNGHFIGTSPTIFIGTPAWGMYANNGNLAEAKRPLPAPMGTNQSFHVLFENGIVDPGAGVGVAMQNDFGDTLWQFFYNGGDTYYSISGGTTDVANTTNGLDIAFSLTSPTTYRAVITPLGGSTRILTGNLDANTNSMDATIFRAWNFNAGPNSIRDVFFNNIRLTTTYPEGSSTSVTVTITREALEFHDGIPMYWWNQYGMGTNYLAADDTDNDGTTNWEEFIADTNPADSDSVYPNRILDATGADAMSLQVGPPTTNSRIYDVWFGTNLMDGQWLPLGLDTQGALDGSAIFIMVTNSGPAGIYRTGVKLP